MKLWILDTPYDYHKGSRVVILAKTAKEAKAKWLQRRVLAGRNEWYDPTWQDADEEFEGPYQFTGEFRELNDTIYVDWGCNC